MIGSVVELNYLFDTLNMSNKSKQKCYDKIMSAILKRPIIDIFEFDEYIKNNYSDYTNNMSLQDWLEKNQKDNLDKWLYYLNISV